MRVLHLQCSRNSGFPLLLIELIGFWRRRLFGYASIFSVRTVIYWSKSPRSFAPLCWKLWLEKMRNCISVLWPPNQISTNWVAPIRRNSTVIVQGREEQMLGCQQGLFPSTGLCPGCPISLLYTLAISDSESWNSVTCNCVPPITVSPENAPSPYLPLFYVMTSAIRFRSQPTSIWPHFN